MLALVIECMLYSPPSSATGDATSSSPPSPPPGGLTVQINVIIFSAIYSFGYSRTSPIAERFAARLLGGDKSKDDSSLLGRAKPEVLQSRLGTLSGHAGKAALGAVLRAQQSFGVRGKGHKASYAITPSAKSSEASATDSPATDASASATSCGRVLPISTPSASAHCSAPEGTPAAAKPPRPASEQLESFSSSSLAPLANYYSSAETPWGSRTTRVLPPIHLPGGKALPFEPGSRVADPKGAPPLTPPASPPGPTPPQQLLPVERAATRLSHFNKAVGAIRVVRRIRQNLDGWRDKRRTERMSLESLEHHLDEATVTLLRAKFVKYDRDNSGQVSIGELSALMDDLGFNLTGRGLRELQRELDWTGEGLISLQELVLWYSKMVIGAVERERRRRTGWRKQWARANQACALPPRVRFVISWLLMWAIFAALAMIAVVYSVLFGHETTRLMLFSWGLAQSQTYSLEEPIIIVSSILLPWVIDTLSSNEVTGEILNEYVGGIISNCVAPIEAVFRSVFRAVRMLVFPAD
ncbi:hypothetical protein T492DRAFT_840620 [Pavlovales sp. CCMP2436]|nr:hypothetical protein T492DRAFT_840620 [Pavlovales sp. CCMP2436]